MVESQTGTIQLSTKIEISVVSPVYRAKPLLAELLRRLDVTRQSLDVVHDSRAEGESSYNCSSLFELAFNNILAISDRPLRLTVRLAFYISVIALGIGVFYLIQYLLGEIEILGFASLIISISFFFGIVIMILGIIGLYLGKVFKKVKDRPIYIISESLENK